MRPLSAMGAAAVVEELNFRSDNDLALLEMAVHGDLGGAAYVRWPDGRLGVLTRSGETACHLERVAGLLKLAKERGIPAPRYDLIADLSDYRAIVQERLPGAPPRHIDRQRMDAILAVNESFAGLLTDRPDVLPPDLRLEQRLARDGVPAVRSLARHNARSRGVLARILEVERSSNLAPAASDLVHRDFAPGNILFDANGQLTGLVDWHDKSTLARGDRCFSLVVLRFDIGRGLAIDPDGEHGWGTIDHDALLLLEDALAAIESETLRLYWAVQSLITVDAVIRNRPAHEVEHQLAIAESHL